MAAPAPRAANGDLCVLTCTNWYVYGRLDLPAPRCAQMKQQR
jgi:hypothetical protein